MPETELINGLDDGYDDLIQGGSRPSKDTCVFCEAATYVAGAPRNLPSSFQNSSEADNNPGGYFLSGLGFDEPTPTECAQEPAADVALDVGDLFRTQRWCFVKLPRLASLGAGLKHTIDQLRSSSMSP